MGREKLDPGAHPMVSALSRMEAFQEWRRAVPWAGGVEEPAARALPQGCPFHTAPAGLPSSSISTIPDWPGPKPQPMGGKEPGLGQKTTAGQELSWMAGRGEGAKVHAGEDGQLLGTCPLRNQRQPRSIPAGPCPTKQRHPVMPWNLRGAQEKGRAGERQDNGRPWLLSMVLIVNSRCGAPLAQLLPADACPPVYLSNPRLVAHQLTGGLS